MRSGRLFLGGGMRKVGGEEEGLRRGFLDARGDSEGRGLRVGQGDVGVGAGSGGPGSI